jgi:hypothetical protein
MEQLHAFDELQNDHKITQKLTAKMNSTWYHFFFPHHVSVFDFLDQRMENGKNLVFWPLR